MPLLSEVTQELGLSPDELELSLQRQTYSEKIRSDFTGGVRSGVNGTPTFFINGARYNGPNDYDYLVEAITKVLEQIPVNSHRASENMGLSEESEAVRSDSTEVQVYRDAVFDKVGCLRRAES